MVEITGDPVPSLILPLHTCVIWESSWCRPYISLSFRLTEFLPCLQCTFGCRSWFSQWVLRPFSLFLWATLSTMVSIIRWLMSQPQCRKLLGGMLKVKNSLGVVFLGQSDHQDPWLCIFRIHGDPLFPFDLHFPPLQGIRCLAQVQSTPYLPDTWQADQLPPGILAGELNSPSCVCLDVWMIGTRSY